MATIMPQLDGEQQTQFVPLPKDFAAAAYRVGIDKIREGFKNLRGEIKHSFSLAHSFPSHIRLVRRR
jgi:hypothetical protein